MPLRLSNLCYEVSLPLVLVNPRNNVKDDHAKSENIIHKACTQTVPVISL